MSYILVSWLLYILWRIYVRPNFVMLVFVRLNSSYVRPKLKVIGQMSCQVKYLFAALPTISTKIQPWISILSLNIFFLLPCSHEPRTALSLSTLIKQLSCSHDIFTCPRVRIEPVDRKPPPSCDCFAPGQLCALGNWIFSKKVCC
jgi:hypothetical protein